MSWLVQADYSHRQNQGLEEVLTSIFGDSNEVDWLHSNCEDKCRLVRACHGYRVRVSAGGRVMAVSTDELTFGRMREAETCRDIDSSSPANRHSLEAVRNGHPLVVPLSKAICAWIYHNSSRRAP